MSKVYTKEGAASNYLTTFKSIFKTELDHFTLALNQGTGITHSLELIVDVHQTEVFGSQRGSFSLSVSSALDAVDSASKGGGHNG